MVALSFNGNKTITTGGGGPILTNDENLGQFVKHLTTTAKLPHRLEFFNDQIGFNYYLPNLNAALGCAQLEQLSAFLEKKRRLFQRYARVFQDLSGVHFFNEPEFARSNYRLNVLLLQNHPTWKAGLPQDSPASSNGDLGKLRQIRDLVLKVTHGEGIMPRPAWRLMHRLPMYQNCPRMDLSVAEKLEACLIALLSSLILANIND